MQGVGEVCNQSTVIPVFSSVVCGFLHGGNHSSPKVNRLNLELLWLFSYGHFKGISKVLRISHSFQLCLCGLNAEDRKTAHGELVGMQFVTEDVGWNNKKVIDEHREQVK